MKVSEGAAVENFDAMMIELLQSLAHLERNTHCPCAAGIKLADGFALQILK